MDHMESYKFLSIGNLGDMNHRFQSRVLYLKGAPIHRQQLRAVSAILASTSPVWETSCGVSSPGKMFNRSQNRRICTLREHVRNSMVYRFFIQTLGRSPIFLCRIQVNLIRRIARTTLESIHPISDFLSNMRHRFRNSIQIRQEGTQKLNLRRMLHSVPAQPDCFHRAFKIKTSTSGAGNLLVTFAFPPGAL